MNKFTTTQVMANAVVAKLEKDLLFPMIVDSSYQEKFVDKGANGKIIIPIITTFEANDFVDSITVQDINEGEVTVELNTFKDVSYKISSSDRVLNTKADRVNFGKRYVEPATAALLNAMEQKIADQAFEVPNYVEGLAGSPASFNDLGLIRKWLRKAGVPLGQMMCVLSVDSHTDMMGSIKQLNEYNASGSTKGVQDAVIGTKSGVVYYESLFLENEKAPAPTIQAGSAIGGAVVAGEEVSLPLTGLVGDEVFGRGNIITFENGVNGAIATEQTATGSTMTLVVKNLTGDVPNGTEFDVIAMGANLAMAPNAIVFASVPLSIEDDEGVVVQSPRFPQLNIRSVAKYDIDTKSTKYSLDFLAATKVVHLDRIVRVNGG